MEKPKEYLSWTKGQSSLVTPAPAKLRLSGWGKGSRPPFQYSNWQIWLLDQWVQYLDQITTTGTPNQTLRLIDGGEWAFKKSLNRLSWSEIAHMSIAGIPDSYNIIPAGNCTLSDGQIAYATVNPPIVILGDASLDSDTILNVNFTGNLSSGMAITGPSIPTGTTILAVGDGTITISQNATATSVQEQLIGCSTGNLSVTVIDEEDFVPELTTIIFAKRLGDEIYVGVNATQMILMDNEFKTFMGSGYFDTYKVVAGEDLAEGKNVYISPGPTSDDGRTVGRIYKLDASEAHKEIRGTFAGTVISSVLAGEEVTVVYNGFFKYSGLTPGKTYWADPVNPGDVTVVKPYLAGQAKVPVGFSVTSENMIIIGAGTLQNDLTQPIFYPEKIGVGDGSNKIFSLLTTPLNKESLFVFLNGGIVEKDQYTLSGLDVEFTDAPGIGVDVYAHYVLSGQNYLQGFQEAPVSVGGSNKIFTITGQPVNKDSLFVFLDGGILFKTEYSLEINEVGATITLSEDKQAAQDIYCYYLSPVGFSEMPSGFVAGLQNMGTGVGIFIGLASNVARLKSIAAGAGVSITDDGETITVSAPGVSGGLNTHGTPSSPVVISGLTIAPSTDQRQIVYIKSNSGNKNVSILPGASIGQELILRGTSSSDTLTIDDGSGTSQNGSVLVNDKQSISYVYDGTVWDEISRRF